ncbi:MAG: hypothetical protein WCF18_13190 [Chthoniobacteraceae bacterium]
MIGQRLADRYELLEEGQRALGGRLFRARDLAFSEIVAVKQIGAGVLGSPGLRQLEAEVRRIQRRPHPMLVRYLALDAPEGILVREWVHGFSLLELIKRRRELPADFALRLLDGLPTILDFVATHALPLPRQLLGKVLVHFEEKVVPDDVAGLPISQWPPFALKLNPLSVRASLLDTEGETTMTTIADLRTASPEQRIPAPARLAELLYEILGGPIRDGRERRYTPLPALREEGNGVLRRALLDSPYQDCRRLWADLALAEPSDLRPSVPLAAPAEPAEAHWTVPAVLLNTATPGILLKLLPENLALPAIHLVARSTFRLGRSLFHADFITRFLPENRGNDDLTNQLSRVHVLAEANGRRLTIRDGNGDTASVNGTTLDDDPLDRDHPASLRDRALLTLGGVYSLEIVPLITPAPPPQKIANLPDGLANPPAPPDLGGAVFFFPVHRQPAVRHSVWLFSHAGFGLDAPQRIVWDQRGSGSSPASFFHDRGCFWLGNRLLPDDALEVAGVALARGTLAPLAKGQALRIGTLHFTVELA